MTMLTRSSTSFLKPTAPPWALITFSVFGGPAIFWKKLPTLSWRTFGFLVQQPSIFQNSLGILEESFLVKRHPGKQVFIILETWNQTCFFRCQGKNASSYEYSQSKRSFKSYLCKRGKACGPCRKTENKSRAWPT